MWVGAGTCDRGVHEWAGGHIHVWVGTGTYDRDVNEWVGGSLYVWMGETRVDGWS